MASEEQLPPELDSEVDLDEMLKELVRKESDDDLEELRRMIKVTGNNLDNYSRQVYFEACRSTILPRESSLLPNTSKRTSTQHSCTG
jgi:hypothetical protein